MIRGGGLSRHPAARAGHSAAISMYSCVVKMYMSRERAGPLTYFTLHERLSGAGRIWSRWPSLVGERMTDFQVSRGFISPTCLPTLAIRGACCSLGSDFGDICT